MSRDILSWTRLLTKLHPIWPWIFSRMEDPFFFFAKNIQYTSSVHVQMPQALLVGVVFNPFIFHFVWIPGITLTYMQDLALVLVEHHENLMGPPFELIQVPLNSIPSFGHVNSITQLGVVCKFAECAPTSMSLTYCSLNERKVTAVKGNHQWLDSRTQCTHFVKE